MSPPAHPANFDDRPPMSLAEYAQTVERVNVGYNLVFELSLAILRALEKPDLAVLVVGAGGGQEIATFAPGNPGWRLTGIDPSATMLALAREHVDRFGVSDRVRLLHGSVEVLADGEAPYDAATCLFVLQFLPDDGAKLGLLQAVAQRLHPGAPLLLVDGIMGHQEELAPAWLHYAAARGMPRERMTTFLERITAGETAAISEERELDLLREAGFGQVTRFYTGLIIHGWIARRA